jgi:hypothetical protein
MFMFLGQLRRRGVAVLGQHLIVMNDRTKQIGDVFLNVVR